MSALTRCRADPSNGIPNDMHLKYYSSRADFGLIITECSQISKMSEAFPGSCGIYT
jgi:N-ethylmaleimide reductase